MPIPSHTKDSLETLTLDIAGRARTLHTSSPALPSGYAVLVFHGSNQTGRGFYRLAGPALESMADRGVVAYLDGYKRNWNDARRSTSFPARRDDVDDVAFAVAAAGALSHRYGVSSERFYAVGYSSGGALVLRLLLEAGARLAGAAVISATMPAPENLLDVDHGAAPVPTALIHGTRDRLVPYDGGMASLWGFRPRGLGLSARETAQTLATRNGITSPPSTTSAPQLSDARTTVTRTVYAQEGHEPVVLHSVNGSGHTVPGPRSAPIIMGRTAHSFRAGDAINAVWDRRLDS